MSEELIKRSDAMKAIQYSNLDTLNAEERVALIKTIPTIEPKTKVVAQITFDEEKLREIVKEAVERFKEEYEITDRPPVIRVKSILKKEDFESLADSIRQQAPNVIVIPHNAELVTPSDRPQGEWIEKIVDNVKITVCSNCDKEPTFTHYYGSCGNYSLSDFCPNCGARMFAKDINVPNKKGADDETD